MARIHQNSSIDRRISAVGLPNLLLLPKMPPETLVLEAAFQQGILGYRRRQANYFQWVKSLFTVETFR